MIFSYKPNGLLTEKYRVYLLIEVQMVLLQKTKQKYRAKGPEGMLLKFHNTSSLFIKGQQKPVDVPQLFSWKIKMFSPRGPYIFLSQSCSSHKVRTLHTEDKGSFHRRPIGPPNNRPKGLLIKDQRIFSWKINRYFQRRPKSLLIETKGLIIGV